MFVDPVVKEAPGSGTPGKVAAGNMPPGRLAPEWEDPGRFPSAEIVAWFQFIKNSKILKLFNSKDIPQVSLFVAYSMRKTNAGKK